MSRKKCYSGKTHLRRTAFHRKKVRYDRSRDVVRVRMPCSRLRVRIEKIEALEAHMREGQRRMQKEVARGRRVYIDGLREGAFMVKTRTQEVRRRAEHLQVAGSDEVTADADIEEIVTVDAEVDI